MDRLEDALSGVVGTKKLFEASSFRTTAALILASPNGAVEYNHLRDVVGPTELETMIKADLLGVQPHNGFARDLGADVYTRRKRTVRCLGARRLGARPLAPF